jgi:transaldolase
MKATQLLHDLGQSLWPDYITRNLLDSGALKRYIDELSVTGLTSNPTIFDHAIKNSAAYDAAVTEKLREGKSGEALFFELALEDITRGPVRWTHTNGYWATPWRETRRFSPAKIMWKRHGGSSIRR